MTLLFSNTKASPVRVSADPSLRRDLVDEDSIPVHDFNEEDFMRYFGSIRSDYLQP